MLFDDEDTALLKKWIVKRLEDISDADSDVLADYVLALLRHDQDEEQVHTLCLEQLDDFLREHTKVFVRDVFAAIKSKSYLSVNSTLSGSAVAPAPSTPPKEATPPPQEPEERRPSFGEEERGQSAGRKRTYNDRERDNGGRDDSPHGRGSPFSRGNKAPRRGALPTGRWSRGENTMNGRGNFRSPGQTHAQPHIEAHSPPFPAPATAIPGMPALGNISSIPNLPNSPPNLAAAMNAQIPPGFPPFDMAAMMAMASGWMPNQVPGQKTGVLDPSQRKRGQKCRDYIQQGFCMRGQMCPYDHGEDVITVPDYKAADEYDPNNAQLFGLEALQNGGGGRGNFNNNYRGRGSSRGGRGRGGRSEFSAVGPNADSRNSTIVVESIPEDKLNDADLQEYFSRFGEVKKITTQSYRRLAIIEFDKHDSARKAHSSPEPIFNNRFIKVFWYKNPDQDATSNKPLFQSSTLKAAGMIEGGEDEEMGGTGEPEFDMEEFQRKQEEAQKAHEAREAKRKAHEEAKKELEKKRIELLAKQAEQKLMMEKLALKKKMAAGKAGSSEPSTAGASTNGSGTPKADGEGKEAMTAALKAQLEKLEQEAASLGIDPNAAGADSTWEGASARGRGGFRGGYRGRGAYRGGYVPPYSARGGASFRGASRARAFAAKSLDNRPKRVAIRGISKDDHKGQEKIREILFSSSLDPLLTTAHPILDSTTVTIFRARHQAELFFTKKSELSASFPDVVFEWVPNDVQIPEEQEALAAEAAARKRAEEEAAASFNGGDAEMGGMGTPGTPGVGGMPLGRRDEYEGDVGMEEEEEGGWLAE